MMGEEAIARGKFLKLIRNVNPNGEWEWVRVKNYKKSVVILPVTVDGDIVFEKQYRYPVNDYVLGFPAGLVEEGESPEDCARRELEEETGYIARDLKFLFSGYLCPGLTDVVAYYYYAPNVRKGGKKNLEPLEDIEIIEVPLEKALDYLMHEDVKFEVIVLGLISLLNFIDSSTSQSRILEK